MNRYDLPLPIRKRSNGWEVVMIDGDSVWGYILCDSRQEAELVADSRPLNDIVVNCGQAEIGRVRRCIDALNRHGLDARALLVRRLMRLADQDVAA
jgi:hypothetical protein